MTYDEESTATGRSSLHHNTESQIEMNHSLSRDEISETCTPTPSSINTASLIQSAARSVLDEKPQTTAFSDEERSHEENISPRLQSLSVKIFPAMPNEQDRKRFVGCFAAVLATAYDYDISDHYDRTEESRARTIAYLEQSEQISVDDEYVYSEQNGRQTPNYSQNAQLPDCSESSRVRQRTNRSMLSRNRHRRRRYDVLSRLLISSADLLLLDKSHARAFLPMLARVLVPDDLGQMDTMSERKLDTISERKPPMWRRNANGEGQMDTMSERAPSERKSPMWRRHRRTNNANQQQEPTEKKLDKQPIITQSCTNLPPKWDQEDHLRPFLDSLSPGAGFRCLGLLLLQHLLHSKEGYDARIRHVIKKLGIIVLIHDMENDPVDTFDSSKSRKFWVERATRKFESLEHNVAARLIQLSTQMKQQNNQPRRQAGAQKSEAPQRRKVTREQIMRGIKIGSAGLVAGTIFAVTGGLAAPGILTGISAIAGASVVGTAAATAAGVLTSTAAVSAIFGVGGGGLAAYKMNRRTQGLSEFEFIKENEESSKAELFSVICISGWLRDSSDFQRPWGVHPRFADKLELLERFYSVYRPDHVPKCRKILASWKGEEKQLWRLLRQTYGRDPHHLFPLEDGSRVRGALTLENEEILDQLFVELGYFSKKERREKNLSPIERMNVHHERRSVRRFDEDPKLLGDTLRDPNSLLGFDSTSVSSLAAEQPEETDKEPPKHLATVWDYRSRYGGEMYTVQWESNMLTEVCDSVTDMAFDIVSGSTTFILRQTAFASLLSAVAIPYVLVNAANMIDSSWTLAIERSDEAGRELAKSLLFSRAGHRPVTLIGFSFGARAIYSCLKELARYQEIWESQSEQKDMKNFREDIMFMREPASIVEDAVLMGLPNHLSVSSWIASRQVVAGRLVNCYSRKDLILSLMFQLKRIVGALRPVCGTSPVEIPGVENFDVTDLVSGHQDYCVVTGDIMERVCLGQPCQISTSTEQEKQDEEI